MYKADRLYDEMKELEHRIAQIDGDDEQSVVEYFRLYTLLIYNYAWLGSIYDIYDANAMILMGNGNKLNGAAEMVHDTTMLLAAFPDMQISLADVFVTPCDKGYKLYRRFYMDGTNLGYSKFGPPTGKSLEGRKALCQSMSTLEKQADGWKITYEYTMYPLEWLKEVCSL